jgi:hypothetical protein
MHYQRFYDEMIKMIEETTNIYVPSFKQDYDQNVYDKILSEINFVIQKGEHFYMLTGYREEELEGIKYKLVESGYEIGFDRELSSWAVYGWAD